MTRWNPPESLPADIDDPIQFNAGTLFIGVAVIGCVWILFLAFAVIGAFIARLVGWA